MPRKIFIHIFIMCFSICILAMVEKNGEIKLPLMKRPVAGEDAFFIGNPKNPEQAILLVPSNHCLNLRFVNPALLKAIRSSQVLVVEKSLPFSSWHDERLISRFVSPSLEKAKQLKLIKNSPFTLEDKPWTHELDASTREFLYSNFKSSLKEIPLNNVHPVFIVWILTLATGQRMYLSGMDFQIQREYHQDAKKILQLDPIEIVKKQSEKAFKGLEYLAQNQEEFYYLTYMEDIKEKVEYFKRMSSISSKKLFEETREKFGQAYRKMDEQFAKVIEGEIDESCAIASLDMEGVIHRNKLWIPRIIDYINTHHNNSIAIMVGAAHFIGSDGIVNLLSREGFEIKPFSVQRARREG